MCTLTTAIALYTMVSVGFIIVVNEKNIKLLCLSILKLSMRSPTLIFMPIMAQLSMLLGDVVTSAFRSKTNTYGFISQKPSKNPRCLLVSTQLCRSSFYHKDCACGEVRHFGGGHILVAVIHNSICSVNN